MFGCKANARRLHVWCGGQGSVSRLPGAIAFGLRCIDVLCGVLSEVFFFQEAGQCILTWMTLSQSLKTHIEQKRNPGGD